MTQEYIIDLITSGEGINTEFKEAAQSVPKSLYETIVSFANTDGGTILLGVKDDGNISGLPKDEINTFSTNISTALNDPDCVHPCYSVNIVTIKISDKIILIIQVPASSQVHKYANRIYIREADADIDITSDQQKVSDLYFRKRSFFTETTIYSGLNESDLDPGLFEKAKQYIRGFRSDHPWINASNTQILKESALFRTDYSNGTEGLTLAAALIFGKDSTIQNLLPAYKVEALVRINDPDRYDDRLTLRTNLIDTYLQMMEFIRRHLPEKFYIENDQRKDLRDIIFREVIGNMIIHREYTSAFSSDLIIEKNSVTLSNPNKPLFHGPLYPFKFSPYPKNPNIRRFFSVFGWADEIGSGVRNTFKYLEQYIPGARPLFIEDELFRTEIPLTSTLFSKYAEQFQVWLELPVDSKPHLAKGLDKILFAPSLSGITWSELILHLVPSWHQKGVKLQPLKWPEKQIYTKSDIKKVPSWNEKGTKLLHKKTKNLITILFLTSQPIRIEQMMKWMEYKKRQSFRELYVLPLQNSGLISMTNPEKPNDPEQKYAITEKGKIFLGAR